MGVEEEYNLRGVALGLHFQHPHSSANFVGFLLLGRSPPPPLDTIWAMGLGLGHICAIALVPHFTDFGLRWC